ncbi:ATP-binding cassette domain-containing protein [Sodalis-like secondary symbiont of Drepanosiphum platanoidis]|uniref:ATP-binding cassette domain-containing protein n=1 Tax=Sodalis-like secondary symbiont of Drepanosiphum platanoidis TaxID=2994493 RepID=UPI0034648607
MNICDSLVKILKLSFNHGHRIIFKNINMNFIKGKITSIMGPSGVGKTTLLHLITGQLKPNSGEIWINNNNITKLSRNNLYKIRKSMSMLFQSGALFTDLTVFENVAFPLRMHTKLTESVLRNIVFMKLETVGLRNAASLMPYELSGGMSRRVALARAISLNPKLIIFDEPFVGQDPISLKILITLINKLNKNLHTTCILVSHDIPEVLSISDYSYILADSCIVAEGSSKDLELTQDIRARQFLDGKLDGPIPFNYISKDNKKKLLDSRI